MQCRINLQAAKAADEAADRVSPARICGRDRSGVLSNLAKASNRPSAASVFMEIFPVFLEGSEVVSRSDLVQVLTKSPCLRDQEPHTPLAHRFRSHRRGCIGK